MAGGDALTYEGRAPSLSVYRTYLAATSIGNYALFGGGTWKQGTGSSVSSVVDAYDVDLTRTTPDILTVGRSDLAATSIENYALFGGGNRGTGNTNIPAVNAYDVNLTHIRATNLTYQVSRSVGTSIGEYAIFVGGSDVNAYDASLVQTVPTRLGHNGGSSAGATSIGGYALFGGGYWYSSGNYYTDMVVAYDTNLTRTTPAVLSSARGNTATSNGKYAIFGSSSVYDVYDENLIHKTTINTGVAGTATATSVGQYMIFAGGGDSSGSTIATVNVFDGNLTYSTGTDLYMARGGLAATSIRNYALFGGGVTQAASNTYTGVVDVYKSKK